MKPKSLRAKTLNGAELKCIGHRSDLLDVGFEHFYTVDGVESWKHPKFAHIRVELNTRTAQYSVSTVLDIDYNVGCLQL